MLLTRTRTAALLWTLLTVGIPAQGQLDAGRAAMVDPGPAESCSVAAGNVYFDPPSAGLVESCTGQYLSGGEDSVGCGRLVAPDLRGAAARTSSVEVLGQAALAFYRQRHPELGGLSQTPPENLADLAVSGRTKFEDFRRLAPQTEEVRAALLASLAEVAPRHLPVVGDTWFAANAATDRAYRVAWALRGSAKYRQANRPALGWIAVSAEHDAPHRPVNVPATAYPVRDLSVNVPTAAGRVVQVKTRYTIAARGLAEAEQPFDPRHLPAEEKLQLAEDAQVVLFLHGHSSRLEEGDGLAQALLADAEKRGEKIAVIAMDLPSNGYASMIEHTRVAEASASVYPGGFPMLAFLDQFVLAFVDELDRSIPIKRRILGLIGGSLGGNLALRLAERRTDWLKNVAAWSPASTWPTFSGGGFIAREGVRITRDRMSEAESAQSRSDYFQQVYRGYGALRLEPAQAGRWFSSAWPCRSAVIQETVRQRQEIYSAAFRRWHWRLAHEQLLFSHDDAGVFGRLPSYMYITARVLLAAGAEDNSYPEYLYERTRDLAGRMPAGAGETLFLGLTGHAIHVERPALLAHRILDFTGRTHATVHAARAAAHRALQ